MLCLRYFFLKLTLEGCAQAVIAHLNSLEDDEVAEIEPSDDEVILDSEEGIS